MAELYATARLNGITARDVAGVEDPEQGIAVRAWLLANTPEVSNPSVTTWELLIGALVAAERYDARKVVA